MSPFRISLTFMVLTLLGGASTYLPDVDFAPAAIRSSFIISVSSEPSDPPLVVEQKVTAILEGVLSTITGMKKIESVSRYGGGYITLTFGSGEDLQNKRLEILTAIRKVRNRLPQNLTFPSINLGSQEDVEEPLLIYSLTSSIPTNEIIEITKEQILPQIGIHPGVKRIALSTDNRPSMVLSYNIHQLQSLGLQPYDIQKSIYKSVIHEQVRTNYYR